MQFEVKGKKYSINSLDISQAEFNEIYEKTGDFDKKTGLGKIEIDGYKFLFALDNESGCKVCFALNGNNRKTGHFKSKGHLVTIAAERNVQNVDKDGKVVFDSDRKVQTHKEILFGFSKHGSMSTGKGGNGIKIRKNTEKFKDLIGAVNELREQENFLSLYDDLYKGVRTFSLDEQGIGTSKGSDTKAPSLEVNYYIAERNDPSKEPVYFVVAPHYLSENRKRTGKDGKSLWMITSTQVKNLVGNSDATIEDLFGKCETFEEVAEMLKSAGSVVVKNISENEFTGKSKVTHYGERNNGVVVDDLTMNVMDERVREENNLKTWTDKSYGKGKASYTKTLKNGIKKHPARTVILTLVTVAALGAIAGATYKYITTRDADNNKTALRIEQENKEKAIANLVIETENAHAFGKLQAMEEIEGVKDLYRFTLNDNGTQDIKMGMMSEIVKNEIKTYTQISWPTYQNANGEMVALTAEDLSPEQLAKIDYTIPVVESYFRELGEAAFSELVGKGAPVGTKDESGIHPNIVYVVGTTGTADDAYQFADNMVNYLTSIGNLDKEEISYAVTSYEEGFLKKFEYLLANGKVSDESIVDETIKIKEVFDYNSQEIQTILSNVTKDSAKLLYVDENVAFAISNENSKNGAGNVLYQLTLPASANVETSKGLTEALKSATLTTTAKVAGKVLGSKYSSALEVFENKFCKDNNVENAKMFVFDTVKTLEGDGNFSVDPNYFMVINNGQEVRVVDNNVKVIAEIGEKVGDLTAVAILGNYVTNKSYLVERNVPIETSYTENEVPVTEVENVSVNEEEKVLA